MLSAADERFIDSLAEENRKQREVIRELIRERRAVEEYWGNLLINVVQQLHAP